MKILCIFRSRVSSPVVRREPRIRRAAVEETLEISNPVPLAQNVVGLRGVYQTNGGEKSELSGGLG